MGKIVKIILGVIVITMLLGACEKVVTGKCTREIDNASVKAIIRTYKQDSYGKRYWEEYEIAFVKYENGKFELNELNFPETVPDMYLGTVLDNFFPIPEIEGISDIQAKIGFVEIYANNSAGNLNGGFNLRSDKSFAFYIYADRNFTVKGSDKYGDVFDCSFEKGWNIRYNYSYNSQEKYITYTTQRPLNEDFRWHFEAICPD